MLKAFTSNLQERLSARLSATLRAQPLSDPFATELVVVQSLGMRRWLQMEIARHNGICAGVDFPFPQTFINDLLERIYPEESKHLQDFSREILEWRVYTWLGDHSTRFADLNRYLVDEKEMDVVKTWQLAARVAHLFDQYSAYRPDWLIGLQNADRPAMAGRIGAREPGGQFEGWQSELWRALIENHAVHPAALRHRFLTDAARIPTQKLPERLSVFGLATLPPWYLKFLEALALRIPVDLYILQPTPEFWADLETRREIEGRRKRGLAPRSEGVDWNSLLASWGKTGRDFFRLAMECESLDENPDFVEPTASGLLGELQRDLLNPERSPYRDPSISSGWNSRYSTLQVHSCPGPLREVEIFRDQLLALFEQIPDLEPRDVLVMTPDLDKYAPFIDAVFGGSEGESIPYSLADRTVGGRDDPGAILLRLLEVATGRFEATEVVDLLELPTIRSRFEISEADLERIRLWVSETGIRWGINAAHRRDFGVPEFPQNTWRSGLDRLLLGFAMEPVDRQLYETISPFELTENSEAVLLGRLIEFIERLSQLRETLSRPANLDEWSTRLRNTLRDFFIPESLDMREACLAKSAIENLEKSFRFVPGKVPFDAIRLHLENALSPDESQLGYLNGGVTFCACRPMRSVPFRVIAMLGMDNGVFPRASSTSSLDRMAAEPRLGDRSQREDDRYLFLEALLSARDVLYLSYHGRSVRDGSDLLPSVLISELLNYVDDQFNKRWSDEIVTRHPIQAFAPEYFSGGKLFSYSGSNLAGAKALIGPRAETTAFVRDPLPVANHELEIIHPKELVSFFLHPTKYFVVRRLGIKLRYPDEFEADSEPFSADGLTRYALKQDAVSSLISKSSEHLPSLWNAEGKLPPGNAGEAISQRLAKESDDLFGKIAPWLQPDPQPAEIDFSVGGIRLTGQLFTRLHFRPAMAKARDQIGAFVTHLIVNAAGYDVPIRLIMEDKSYVWEAIDGETARAILETFVALYRRGLSEPLPFFPQTAMALIEKKSPHSSWKGNGFSEVPPESKDPYFRLCFGHLEDPLDDQFAELARAILGPLIERRKELL